MTQPKKKWELQQAHHDAHEEAWRACGNEPGRYWKYVHSTYVDKLNSLGHTATDLLNCECWKNAVIQLEDAP